MQVHLTAMRFRQAAGNRPRSGVVTRSTAKDWHELPMKHVVDSKQFSKAAMDAIFAEALKMEVTLRHIT